MGVASYREDIYLRFLESIEQVPDAVIPGPPDEICPFCGRRFEKQSAMLEHLSEAHRGDRPILLLNGREPDRHCQIGYRLQKERILVQNCIWAATALRLRAASDAMEPLRQLRSEGVMLTEQASA